MINVRLVGLGLLLAMTAVHAEAIQFPDRHDRNAARKERQAIWSVYNDFAKKGDLLAARRFMEENKLLEKRIVDSLEATMLYFEIEEYTLAVEQIEFLIAERMERGPEYVSQGFLNWRLLTRAAKNGVAPNWTSLPNESEQRNPAKFVSLMAYAAIGQHYFRTAEFLMKELPKLGIDLETMQRLTSRLADQRLEQKKLQEADKVKPASDPKPGQ